MGGGAAWEGGNGCWPNIEQKKHRREKNVLEQKTSIDPSTPKVSVNTWKLLGQHLDTYARRGGCVLWRVWDI